MKKLLSVLTVALIVIMTLTSCGAPKTLEEYIAKDADTQEQIEQLASDNDGLSIDVKENTIYYVYDISGISSALTEEIATSKEMKDTFESQIGSAASTFEGLCSQLEEETKIDGIKMVVTYTYKDKEIISQEFTSNKN